jgi:hypothetical protein
MENAQIFQLAAGARWSNTIFILVWAAVLIFDVYFVRYTLRLIREVKGSSRQREEWKAARDTIFMMFLGLLDRAITGPPIDNSRRSMPDLNPKSRKGGTIAISLVAVVMCSAIVSFVTFTESPLQLAVSSKSVTLIYRLPWRDRTIPLDRITRVDLAQSQDKRDSTRVYYDLLIFRDGKEISISGGTKDPYESQLKSAYGAILTQLRFKQKSVPVAKSTASSSS